jgi:hypothetical protein
VLPVLGAVGPALVEDGTGWSAAACRPVSPTGGPRVYETVDGTAWVELVQRRPLEIGLSTRHDCGGPPADRKRDARRGRLGAHRPRRRGT